MDTTGAGDGFLGGFLHYFVKAGDTCSTCPPLLLVS